MKRPNEDKTEHLHFDRESLTLLIDNGQDKDYIVVVEEYAGICVQAKEVVLNLIIQRKIDKRYFESRDCTINFSYYTDEHYASKNFSSVVKKNPHKKANFASNDFQPEWIKRKKVKK